MEFSISHDLHRLTKDVNRLHGKLKQAAVRGINRGAQSVKVASSKAIKERTGLKASTIKKRLIIKRARVNDLSASIDASTGRVFNLITSLPQSQRRPGYFNARVGRGKRRRYRANGVKANAWNQRAVYPGTFIVKTKRGVLVAKRASKRRTPLIFVKGPSIRGSFQSNYVQAAMRSKAAEAVIKNVRHEIQRAIHHT
ncbi:phage tail protein [Pleionea sediminis]|uniref:phage tail protein n=1 Tax=Pleionea sediminis TaxID=2569479 RepID=UPI001185A4B7|nr:phage tail protein [Pleionea sediminis]